MIEESDIERIRVVWRSEPRIRFDEKNVSIAESQGDLVLEGEVEDIGTKQLMLRRAAAAMDGEGIIDRLSVRPAERMEDGRIRDLLRGAFVNEQAFVRCHIVERIKGEAQLVQEPLDPEGTIELRVAEGIVTLDGDVPGLVIKRLAGVLAWWIPGSRDVVNGLGVTPPEEDNDEAIVDAVRTALEKDPFVNAEQICVEAVSSVVVLTGLVASEAERDMAEHDAWYIFGVDDVVNSIAVDRRAAAS